MLRDAENLYRFLALRNERQMSTVTKTFKIRKLERKSSVSQKDENICPICCDVMDLGVQMTCDSRHMFHKDCVQ